MKHPIVLAMLSMSLTACQQADANICGSLPMKLPNAAVQSAEDQRQVLNSCMERWAARLSHSPDAASLVARAAVAACDEARIYYADLLEAEKSAPNKQTTREFWIERTLFIAVQTRAGNCYNDA